jgi:hypothetical protein
LDKEVGDSTALKPVLADFRATHPAFRYGIFAADSAFDSYDNYTFLLKECGFSKTVIPVNPRGGLPAPDVNFNESGRPLCPRDGTPFYFHGINRGAHRSTRFKYICPKSRITKLADGRSSWLCQCDSPCGGSAYGRCVYTYPDKNLRLYPGLPRDSEEFTQIYNRRASVERSINTLKDTLGIQGRKTSNVLTTKADLFLAGIVQLLCVLLAHKLHDVKLARRPRRLIA